MDLTQLNTLLKPEMKPETKMAIPKVFEATGKNFDGTPLGIDYFDDGSWEPTYRPKEIRRDRYPG